MGTFYRRTFMINYLFIFIFLNRFDRILWYFYRFSSWDDVIVHNCYIGINYSIHLLFFLLFIILQKSVIGLKPYSDNCELWMQFDSPLNRYFYGLLRLAISQPWFSFPKIRIHWVIIRANFRLLGLPKSHN